MAKLVIDDEGEGNYSPFQMRTVGTMYAAMEAVAELCLTELVKCRGGPGVWLDEFQADVIRKLKNPETGGISMTDEVQIIETVIHLTNRLFDGVREDFDGDSTPERSSIPRALEGGRRATGVLSPIAKRL